MALALYLQVCINQTITKILNGSNDEEETETVSTCATVGVWWFIWYTCFCIFVPFIITVILYELTKLFREKRCKSRCKSVTLTQIHKDNAATETNQIPLIVVNNDPCNGSSDGDEGTDEVDHLPSNSNSNSWTKFPPPPPPEPEFLMELKHAQASRAQ